MAAGDLVFLDTETTGLDPQRHEIWEMAYAVNDGPVQGGLVYHSLRNADPYALDLNGYHSRAHVPIWKDMHDLEIGARAALSGATIVGANPAFDAAFLEARWGEKVWHYRMLNIESFAMPILGFDRPKGLKDIYLELVALGYELPENDHSAVGDVITLQAAFYFLNNLKVPV